MTSLRRLPTPAERPLLIRPSSPCSNICATVNTAHLESSPLLRERSANLFISGVKGFPCRLRRISASGYCSQNSVNVLSKVGKSIERDLLWRLSRKSRCKLKAHLTSSKSAPRTKARCVSVNSAGRAEKTGFKAFHCSVSSVDVYFGISIPQSIALNAANFSPTRKTKAIGKIQEGYFG